MRELALSANGGDLSRLPVVLLADGTMLTMPSNAELAGEVRPADRADAPVLRPGDHRRRARRAGVRRLRRVRRAEGGAHRAERAGRPGRHELDDRELSRLSQRRHRRRSRAPRRDAGQALRHRAAGRPFGRRPQARGPVQGRAAVERRGSGVSRAAAVVRHGGPRAGRAGHHAAHRLRRLLRRGAVGGGDVSRPARVRAGRRELGGAGRAVLRALRRARHDDRPQAGAARRRCRTISSTGSRAPRTSR